MMNDDFNVEDFDDFDLGDEEYKRAGSNCFRAPANAVEKGKALVWSEKMTIRKLALTEWDGGANALPGDVTFRLDLQLTTDPDSEFDETESNNVNNRLFDKSYFNLTAWKERPASGHAQMTNGSIRTIKQIAKVLGIDNDYDGNPAKFISMHAEDCLGESVRVFISQKENGEYGYQDEITAISRAQDDED